MPSTTIVAGVFLILIGLVGYFFSDLQTGRPLTALIPAAFGLLLVILGAIAKSSENLRKHIMHVAVIVGLLGFFIPAARLLMNFSKLTVTLSVITQALMALVCLFFVILCIQSFVNARRNRTGEV